MAQRFIIDGNFTQSLANVRITADACPNDFIIRPTLHYQVGSGDICYDYDDRICFDYHFDDERVITLPTRSIGGVNWPVRKAQATKGRFQFIGDTVGYESSSYDVSHPTSSVNDTLYILINSESAAGTNLYPYLTRNPKSGSIIFTSLSQTVEFEYNSFTSSLTPNSSSADSDSGYGDQIILGATLVTSSNVIDTNNSTLHSIISTRNTPFVHNDRVCIEVRPSPADVPPLQDVMEVGSSSSIAISSSADVALSGSGDLIINNITASNISASDALFASLSLDNELNLVVYNTESGQLHYTSSNSLEGNLTQYQTGSSPSTALDLLTILDFDPNVFVTSSGGNLILQFGTPPTPNSISITTVGFALNRFNLTPDNYDVNFSYNLNGTTYQSSSLFQGTFGSKPNTTLISSVTDGDGTDTYTVSSANSLSAWSTGSQAFTATLAVLGLDGTLITTSSVQLNKELAKTDPDNPTLNLTFSVEKNAYISAGSEFEIEEGATGSIDIKLTGGASNGGGTEPWTNTSPQFSDGLNGATITATVNATDDVFITSSTTTTEDFEEYWNSVTYNDPVLDYTGSVDRTYTRVRSLRYGTSFNEDFTGSLSDLQDITNWIDNVGDIDVGENTQTEINERTFIVSGSAEFVYIIYDSAITAGVTLTNIDGNQIDINNGTSTVYTSYTVGSKYKVWKTNLPKSGEVNYRINF